ncbi:efflux transporter outer membrane subunit [Rhodoferax sp. GW822-FHT02A01]|uniref:efflux transporter outer membrane subunit n=1 Tax=Rhodoferax sp. GW822-FHT02A01 TaxID=3141537 RepID=UPI00315D461E
MLSRWGSLLLVLLLAACAQPSEYVRPELPVPTQWPGVAGDPQEVSRIHWRQYFVDPRLHALIESALKNNRDLRIAVGRVQEAKAQYGIAQADRYPSVNLLSSAAFTGVPESLSSTTTAERYDLGVSSISYEVDFWGRIAGLTESARNSYLATEEAQKAFQVSLIADIATTYFTLLQLDEQIAFATKTLQSRAQSLDLVKKGRDAGGAYDLEVEQAQGLQESARAALDAYGHQRNTTVNRLNYLVGEVVPDLPPPLPFDSQGFGEVIIPGLPSDVLLLRPDVIAAEKRLLAAHANIDAARAAFMPKVLLTTSLGVASAGLSSLFSGAAWTFQPLISAPLFDGGRLTGGKELAEARKVIAVADYEKTIQMAFREVADLLSARGSLARQMRSARINEKSQQRLLDIAQARHNIGLTGYNDVLERQRDLVAAQQITLQLRRSQLETAAQLYKALGGGA